MIRPIPPKFKVMIAGIVLVIGGLTATRFPADKSEKLFTAHKTNSESGSPLGSGVTVLRPPTALSLSNIDQFVPAPPANENHAEDVPSNITSHYSMNSATLSGEKVDEQPVEEPEYIPFQEDQTLVSRTKDNAFGRSSPSPPTIVPASIQPDDSVNPGLQPLASLPPIETITTQRIDALKPSDVNTIPVTKTSQTVFYPDSRTQSKQTNNVVTAQGSVLIRP